MNRLKAASQQSFNAAELGQKLLTQHSDEDPIKLQGNVHVVEPAVLLTFSHFCSEQSDAAAAFYLL